MTSIPASKLAALQPEATKDINPVVSADILLQVSRRLDWRFLLPDPDLKRVAYLGPENNNLLEALLFWDPSVTHSRALQDPNEVSPAFDLVVVKNPSIQALELAEKLVRPGGYLYVEAIGWSKLIKPQNLLKRGLNLLRKENTSTAYWFPSHCKDVIRRFGFSSIHTYWHWPNFETCTRMIRLDDTDLRTLAFSFQEAGVQLFLKKALICRLLPPGWVQYGTPNFSIIAGKDLL